MKRLLLIVFLSLFTSVACAQGTTLLDFYAEWCGPCKSMAPVVDRLAVQGYSVTRVNIDVDRAMAVRFGIDAVPTYIVVERGVVVDRVTGITTIERLKRKMRPPAKRQSDQPTRAWIYTSATGHRAALVHIYAEMAKPVRIAGKGLMKAKEGTGTVVRWGGKLFIVTARHVVDGTKRVIRIVLATGVKCTAHVLVDDPTWDCAVLGFDTQPQQIAAVEVEVGNAAVLAEGARLESCGYGPDKRMASNNGVFVGYRRDKHKAPNGPDDWMVITGHARQGDSGGGVFNERGRLVGVIWGYDGGTKTVICVQPGRVHVVLESARKSR